VNEQQPVRERRQRKASVGRDEQRRRDQVRGPSIRHVARSAGPILDTMSATVAIARSRAALDVVA